MSTLKSFVLVMILAVVSACGASPTSPTPAGTTPVATPPTVVTAQIIAIPFQFGAGQHGGNQLMTYEPGVPKSGLIKVKLQSVSPAGTTMVFLVSLNGGCITQGAQCSQTILGPFTGKAGDEITIGELPDLTPVLEYMPMGGIAASGGFAVTITGNKP